MQKVTASTIRLPGSRESPNEILQRGTSSGWPRRSKRRSPSVMTSIRGDGRASPPLKRTSTGGTLEVGFVVSLMLIQMKDATSTGSAFVQARNSGPPQKSVRPRTTA